MNPTFPPPAPGRDRRHDGAAGDGHVVNHTESLCPECLRRIPAQNVRRGDDVHLVKRCPEHGSFSAVIWRGSPRYEDWGKGKDAARRSAAPANGRRGCPFDCGSCREHRQRPCAVLLEVTSRCDLACPVCFAAAGNRAAARDPSLADIEDRYRALLAAGEPVNVQLSGGEPTLRDDLPDIVSLGRRLGFDFLQINTNGLRLGEDPGYVDRLRAAGLNCVFLQFDGLDDRVHERIRGAPLLRPKEAAVRHCLERDIGVVLVATLVAGVNTDGIGRLVRYALERTPGIRAVHFQPMGFIGRYPKAPRDEDRVTLPEVIRALETQTGGLVKVRDFIPPGAENAHCSFHGNFSVGANGSLTPWPAHAPAEREPAADAARHARNFVARQWSAPPPEPAGDSADSRTEGLHPDTAADIRKLLSRLGRHTLSISGMAFQDIWNLDLNRLRDCHIGIADPGRGLVPFCAYNLRSRAGQALYRTGGGS